MEYEDVLTIQTPEGLELDVALAGLGSRFVAGMVDLFIKAAVVTVIWVAVVPLLGLTGVAIAVAASFAVYVGYDMVFELRRAGQTPGKKSAGIRVVRAPNRPVDLAASAIRNVLRVVDGLPLSYIPGMISILVTKRNQRLGDLAAGTLVVRERRAAAGTGWASWSSYTLTTDTGAASWDVTGVSATDVATIQRFLDRRASLSPDARSRLALQLAEAVLAKVGGVQPGLDPEAFLAQLVARKSSGR